MTYINMFLIVLLLFWIVAALQQVMLHRLETRVNNQKNFIHILEEELNEIHQEQDLMFDWMNETGVIIAGLNDGNQKRKVNLNPA